MDAIIRQTVREEMRRQGQNSNEHVESTAPSASAPAPSTSAPSNSNQRTVNRLSGLLERIRGQPKGKKERPIKNIEFKFGGFITTRIQSFLFQFVRRRVEETALLLIVRWNLLQLKT